MPWIPASDGNHIFVRVVGRGQPVVLLHGFASQSAHWLPNILPLAHRFKFIMPDFRGFGRSSVTPITSDQVFEQFAHDLEAVLQHFNLQQVILGGISTGAYTCLVYNHLYGFGRVSRYLNIEHSPEAKNHNGWNGGLFLSKQDELFSLFTELASLADAVGASTPYKQLPHDARKAFSLTLARVLARALNNPLSRIIARNGGRYAEPVLAGTLFPVTDWYAYIQVMKAFIKGYDTRATLDTIKVPTTLMIGERSRFFSKDSQLEIKRHVPHANVVLFPRAGHIPMLDQPVQFQRQFQRFFLRASR